MDQATRNSARWIWKGRPTSEKETTGGSGNTIVVVNEIIGKIGNSA